MNAAAGWPDWLVRRLVGQGLMDGETGATRRARAVACERCGRAVFRGLDAEWGSRSRDADPVPLSGLGEVQAIMAGRKTLELSGTVRLELNFRDRWRIGSRPAGGDKYDVLVEHRCEDKTQFDAAPRKAETKKAAISDIPPY